MKGVSVGPNVTGLQEPAGVEGKADFTRIPLL